MLPKIYYKKWRKGELTGKIEIMDGHKWKEWWAMRTIGTKTSRIKWKLLKWEIKMEKINKTYKMKQKWGHRTYCD